jgi:hypothetical protein
MMRRLFTTAMAAGLLFATGAAAAPAAQVAGPAAAPVADQPDLKCLIIAMAAIESGRADAQQPGVLGAIYYLGRLDARTPGLDLRSAIAAEEATLKPETMGAEAARCAAELKSRSAAIRALGDAPALPGSP